MTKHDESHSDYAERLAALRQEMATRKLDVYLVPMTDAFQNEYIPPSDKRIAFLTGFTGSAGFIVVLAKGAAFFTDGRYTLQAAAQISQDLYALFDSATMPPATWIRDQSALGFRIGFDPRLHTAAGIERLEKILEKTGGELIPVTPNLVDAIWLDRPHPPMAPVVPYDLRYAGISSAEKRAACAQTLRQDNCAAAVITDPASVAWLFNVRGDDVPHAPLPLSYALLQADGTALWFVAKEKLTPDLDAHLGSDIQIHSFDSFEPTLRKLGRSHARVRVDLTQTPYALVHALARAGGKIDKGADPTLLPRACKNDVEQNGMRRAHIRDGVAVTRFLAWIDDKFPSGKVTELTAETQLESYRAEQDLFKGPSFETIAGFGPDGAIVHYRATEETCLKLETDNLFLVDSGAQYLDGTTDVTRTIILGTPTHEMREHFTRVLKGHISLAMAVFPEGTSGADLDVLARQPLWEKGLDYAHGTGHGVGCYLVVHEGPQAISRRASTPLRSGMVLSNEPGFYRAGAYGIRLENLMLVVPRPELSKGSTSYLGFEPLTLAPFDRRGIMVNLLTPPERAWIDAYHARVRKTLEPLLPPETAAWLSRATLPL